MNTVLSPYIVNILVVIIVAISFLPTQNLPPLSGVVQWLNLYAYRSQLKWALEPDNSIVRVVEFDKTFFDETGARITPIDRKHLAKILDKLSEMAPKVVAIDIDIYYRLRPTFEQSKIVDSFTEEGLKELDEADDALIEAVNKLSTTTRVVLPAPPQQNKIIPMDYKKSSNLYFADTKATIRTPDQVIYELPVWKPRSSDDLLKKRQPRPSFAFATWAAYHGIPYSFFLTGKSPKNLEKSVAHDLDFFKSDRSAYVNWYRILKKKVFTFQPFSAATVIDSEPTKLNVLTDKIVLIGRTVYQKEPILEHEDVHYSPYLNKRISGLFLQGIFIDNLINRLWLAKMNWFSGLFFGTLLSIVLGCFIISVSQYTGTHSVLKFFSESLSNPIWALGIGIALVMSVTFLVNLFFLKKGLYTFSIFLIPLTAYLEAALYAVFWKTTG